MGRVGPGGRPRRAAQAAPHRQEDLRPAGRGEGLRRLLLDRPALRARVEARPLGRRGRGLPGAGVGAGHLPGGLRQLPRRRRGRGACPQAAGGDASPLQRQAVRRPEVAEVGVPVRGARGGLLALGPRPEGAGPGQRDRGGQDGPRRGDGVRAVLPVQGALPRRVEVLQPILGQREGVGGERGRLPEAQPPRAGAQGRVARRAERPAGGGVRAPERRGEVPRAPRRASTRRAGPRCASSRAAGSPTTPRSTCSPGGSPPGRTAEGAGRTCPSTTAS